jgi:hypothetical protein
MNFGAVLGCVTGGGGDVFRKGVPVGVAVGVGVGVGEGIV